MLAENEIEIWGGLEGTINRVGDAYHDQSEYSGHYNRPGDIDLIASLGIKMLRYPVLWEKHQPQKDTVIDWSFVERSLTRLKELNVEPIAGLVHHGSGPAWVNFFDGSFEEGVANYARLVAEKFPWLEYYTPVNEPLTTARFCGLYGHWYPHKKDNYSFYKILLSELKATVMAMRVIREINPDAKLVQTEDLAKVYSTPLLKYQADFENQRRWISYDLLCGRVDEQHPMWNFLTQEVGLTAEELLYFRDNYCIPYVCGFNYYLTSERYLDEDMSKYPVEFHGGNHQHQYADIHTVLVPLKEESGPYVLLREAYEHLQLPLAITECHLHSTREEQMRWFNEMWETVNDLKAEGVDIRALTAWAIFGLHGWNKLVTEPWGTYEPGVFNVSTGCPRPTALARLIQVLTRRKVYYHPVLETEGWWKRDTRPVYPANVIPMKSRKNKPKCQPVLVLGKSGTLGAAFSKLCLERNIHHMLLSRADVDITDAATIEQVIQELHPWAIVNAAGYVRVDEAEQAHESCMEANCNGPVILAELCKKYSIKLVNFSSDLVFDGAKDEPYVESDSVNPLNVYGRSKAMMEEKITQVNENALIIRTSSFFSPWDNFNFVTTTLADLKEGRKVVAANDVHIAATYVPDLVNETLDLLLDDQSGIFHITNDGETTWADLARQVAIMAGCDQSLVVGKPLNKLGLKAKRPNYSVLKSEKGIKLPTLEHALQRYFEAVANVYQSGAIAV
ncbi:family 1 glycosylhydrolase [Aridibaculum aurantiacum]|uniref:family 1 glycosylhydrolase n=1 Tax=Aridibaculum aurantiacum TaxID=2810307 RepID=UPI001A96631E|nr:family 1 glycosylhydrolase [Aridibaculum aurantiacum]